MLHFSSKMTMKKSEGGFADIRNEYIALHLTNKRWEAVSFWRKKNYQMKVSDLTISSFFREPVKREVLLQDLVFGRFRPFLWW